LTTRKGLLKQKAKNVNQFFKLHKFKYDKSPLINTLIKFREKIIVPLMDKKTYQEEYQLLLSNSAFDDSKEDLYDIKYNSDIFKRGQTHKNKEEQQEEEKNINS